MENSTNANTENVARILCTTLLAETSPQALPLGAACIASAIKQRLAQRVDSADKAQGNVQASVHLVNFSPEDTDLIGLKDASIGKSIAKKLASEKPQIVCFSVYVWNRFALTETAYYLKKLLPDVFCIAGGPEISADPQSFTGETNNPFDYLIVGEGEKTICDLVFGLFDGEQKTMPIIQGEVCDIETLSSPYLDGTLNPSLYGGALWELARGCPFSCSYCYESKGEKTVRYIPKERIYAELDFFIRSGVDQVFVLDPTYNIDTKRALEMLLYIKKNAPDIFFHFECRPEFIDRPLANAFADIPCSLQIGLQSSDEKVLAAVNRTFDKKKFVRNVGFLNDVGAVFGFDLIYGLPSDNLSGFMRSMDFALSLYPNHLEIFCLAVLPGTDLFDQSAELKLQFMAKPPYHIQSTPNFSSDDLYDAERLANACSLFYTRGRAVSWFLALLKPLKQTSSSFFADFSLFLEEKKIVLPELCTQTDVSTQAKVSAQIIRLQKDFVQGQYIKKKLRNLLPFVDNLISLNGAIAAFMADGTESQLPLTYHPDDLLSPYAQDPRYFVENAESFPCRVEVSNAAAKESSEDVYRIL